MIFEFVPLLLLLALAQAQPDYEHQGAWPGQCLTGLRQSPIDINSKTTLFCPKVGYYKITLICQDFPKVVTGSDMSIETIDKAFVFFYNPQENTYEAYKSYNLHFHALSEHTVNKRHFGAEMHIKLQPTTVDQLPPEALGEYSAQDFSSSVAQNHFHSVVSLLFQEQNTTADFFEGAITQANGQTYLNLYNMAGCVTQRYWYSYIGSTTTPNCIQDVRWLISREPVPLSPENLLMIKETITEADNFRETQPLNGRSVSLLGAPCLRK